MHSMLDDQQTSMLHMDTQNFGLHTRYIIVLTAYAYARRLREYILAPSRDVTTC